MFPLRGETDLKKKKMGECFRFNVEIQRPWIQFFNWWKDGGKMLRLNSSGSEACELRERQHREDLCTMNWAKIFNHTVEAKKVKHHQSHTRSPIKLCLVLGVTQSDANHQNHGMSLSTSERLGKPLFKICAAFSEWEEDSKTWETDSEWVLSESRKNRGTGCHNVFYIVG